MNMYQIYGVRLCGSAHSHSRARPWFMPLVKRPLSGHQAPREKLFRVSILAHTLSWPNFPNRDESSKITLFFFNLNQSILFEKRFVLGKIVLASKKKFFLSYPVFQMIVLFASVESILESSRFLYPFPSSFVRSIDRSTHALRLAAKRRRRGLVREGSLWEPSRAPMARCIFVCRPRQLSHAIPRRGQTKDDRGGLLTSKVWFTVVSILDPR